MLIKVNRKELTKHISIVQKAISQRTTMQILEGIKISAKDNTLILTATDTEISIKTKLNAIVEREGEIVINYKKAWKWHYKYKCRKLCDESKMWRLYF